MCRETRNSPVPRHGLATTWRSASIGGWLRTPFDTRQRTTPAARLAFTLIELLTVIAIIAVLATLLMTTLSSVKRKAKEAVCISNLHQIGLALNLYLEDFGKRPPDLRTLVTSKYLGNGEILSCPADRSRQSSRPSLAGGEARDDKSTGAEQELHVSYQDPLGWPDEEWSRLMRANSEAGIAVCTYHDVRTTARQEEFYNAPLEGLVLRAQLDGVVVRRQVYFASTVGSALSPPPDRNVTFPLASPETAGNYDFPGTSPPWHYFSDELQP